MDINRRKLLRALIRENLWKRLSPGEVRLYLLLIIFVDQTEKTGKLRKQDIEKYKKKRQAGVTNATVNRDIACLKHIFTKTIEWGIVKENPGKKVKLLREKNTRLRYLEEEEIKRLYNTCAEHLKPIVIVALNTGMRKEEILSLKWKDLDFRTRTISILDTKNNEKRAVPMNDIVVRTLLATRKIPDSPWVFCKENGERYGNVRKSFEGARKRTRWS